MAKDLEDKKKEVAKKMKGKKGRQEFTPEDDFSAKDESKEKKFKSARNGKMPKSNWEN